MSNGDNRGTDGAWIGFGLVAATIVYVTGNPWFGFVILGALISY